MFESLMHALTGNSAQNVAVGSTYPGTITASQLGQYQQVMPKESRTQSKKIFHGTVEVLQVANGYVINIGRKEGYEYETYIAETITDVNERIAAAIVAFQLEK